MARRPPQSPIPAPGDTVLVGDDRHVIMHVDQGGAYTRVEPAQRDGYISKQALEDARRSFGYAEWELSP